MLYFVAWLTDFAAILFVFAGTRYLAEQNASPLLLGLLGASFFLASAVSSASSGLLADRVGRRRVALTGSGLFLASLAALAIISPDSRWFYAAYTFVGVAVGLIYPPVMAWLGHGKSGRSARRAYFWFCLAFNSGIVSAQLTGGWMFEQIGPRAPLWVAMGLTAIGFLCLLRHAEPTGRSVLAAKSESEANDVRLSRAFVRLTWIANFGGMFSMSILWFQFPVLVVGLNIEPATHGLVLAVGRVVVMSTYCAMYLFPFWQHRFEMAAAFQCVGVAGLLAIALGNSSTALAVGVAGLSGLMGYNYFASLFYSARGNGQERKGRAFGLNEASLGFGAAGGSFFGGLAGADFGSRAPFLAAASLLVILLLAQILVFWRRVRPLGHVHDDETALLIAANPAADIVQPLPGCDIG